MNNTINNPKQIPYKTHKHYEKSTTYFQIKDDKFIINSFKENEFNLKIEVPLDLHKAQELHSFLEKYIQENQLTFKH